MRCGLARSPGAKSTRFPIIPVVSFSHGHAFSSRLQRNAANLPSGRWVPTLPSQTLDIKENNQHGLELSKNSCMLFWALEMMLTSTALIVSWFPDHT